MSLASACSESPSPASSAILDAQPSASASDTGGASEDVPSQGSTADAEVARDAEAAPSDTESAESFSLFTDPATGFQTFEVHDADREVVYFDPEASAMVSALSEDAVGGWTTQGNDLRWTQSGVAFRVRFGTEAGVRRAYFTETGNGTICNLTLSGPDALGIRATSETPPNP